MDSIISIKAVNFTYNKGKDNEFQALINVNLEIFPEEFVIIFGPSGCGKSTILNIMAGLETPDNGEIHVLDRDLMNMSKREFAMYHRNQIGMIYQAYNLITSLTVLDNVALPQIFVNVRKGKRNKWAMSLLERFGIDKQYKKIPTELSGGQQQRIGIARAIVNNPLVVLADEPVGNLDSVSAKNVLDILADLNDKEKKTVIMVTHNPENLIYGDRIIYMKDGVIVREEIIKHDKIKEREMVLKTKTPVVEIKDLMRTYQGLTPEQINILIMPYKAKVFAHHFITSRNLEETKAFEDIIQRKLLASISDEDFFDVLHSNAMEGGVGFNKQTADKIIKRTDRLIRITYFVYQKYRQRKNQEGRHEFVSEEEKINKVRQYLLNTCYFEYQQKLSSEEISRMELAIKERLAGNIQKTDFYKALDTPFKDGGVGLNSKTAKIVSEEMELILILGFGISQKPKILPGNIDKIGDKNNNESDNGKNIQADGNTPVNNESAQYSEDQDSETEKTENLLHDDIEEEVVNKWTDKNIDKLPAVISETGILPLVQPVLNESADKANDGGGKKNGEHLPKELRSNLLNNPEEKNDNKSGN